MERRAASPGATVGTASSRSSRISTCRVRRADVVPEAAVGHGPGRDPAAGGRRRDRRGAIRRCGEPSAGRAIRAARDPAGELRDRLPTPSNSARAAGDPDVVDAGDANVGPPGWNGPRDDLPQGAARWRGRAPSRSCSAGTIRSPGRRRRPSPRSAPRCGSGSSTSTHMRTRPTTTGASRGPRQADAPAHRVGRGRSAATSCRWAFAATGRPRPCRVDARAGHALAPDARDRGARRGGRVDDAIDEALDGPDTIYLSLDIDVIDPGSPRAPARPSPEAC